MLKPSTVAVARGLAASLDDHNIALTVKSPHYPVGVMADHFHYPIEPKYASLSLDAKTKLCDGFKQANGDLTELAGDEYDKLVELMGHGIQRLMTTVRGVVIPTCKAVKATYDNVGDQRRIPTIEVTPFHYAAIHSDTAVVEHITTDYGNVRGQDTYRTFILQCPSTQQLIEWMGETRYVDSALVGEWATSLDEDVFNICEVWYTLFGDRRELTPSDIHFTQRGRLPFSVDSIMVGYLLTAYLCANPMDPEGETVSLKEWEDAMTRLHAYLGSSLYHAYQQRAKQLRNKRLVLAVVGTDPVRTGELQVMVNGDLYADWFEENGDVKMILGAAVAAPGLTHVADLEARREELIKTWERKHHVIRQACLDRYLRERRNYLRDIVQHQLRGMLTGEDDESLLKALPSLDELTLTERLNAVLSSVKEEDLDDPWRVITRVVCRVFYPNTPYEAYLESMDRIAKQSPEMPAREVATLATIEMTAHWLAQQVAAHTVIPDLRESEVNAPKVEPTTEPEAVEPGGVADDSGDTPGDAGPVDEDDDANSEVSDGEPVSERS